MDALALLRMQIEWGADEALELQPVDRLRPPPAVPARPPLRPGPAAAAAVAPEAPRVARPAALGQPAMAPVGSPVAAPMAAKAAAQALAAGCDDIASLRAAIAGFDGCSLRDTATHSVFAEGDAAAGLMIVGEVPDAEEDRAGHPFAGRAGLLLDRMLESIGLDRQHLLLTTLIPWRPPGNRPPTDLELAICLPFLDRLLALARPRRLLLLGSRPAKLLAGTTIRGKLAWQKLDPARTPPNGPATMQALALRHPAYLLSHPPAKRDAWAGLLLLRRTLDADAAVSPGEITDA